MSWNQRDLLLYGVGIGAKANDFAIINGTCPCLLGRSTSEVKVAPSAPRTRSGGCS